MGEQGKLVGWRSIIVAYMYPPQVCAACFPPLGSAEADLASQEAAMLQEVQEPAHPHAVTDMSAMAPPVTKCIASGAKAIGKTVVGELAYG